MAEYIEREVLCHRIRAFATNVIFRGCEAMLSAKDSCNPREWTKGYEQGVKDSSDLIATQFAADVAPVVHGRWVEWWPPKHMILTGEEMLYRCSVCDAKYSDKENMRFCPWCGAKMDGGEANGTE